MDIQEVVRALEQDVQNTIGGYSRALVAERVRELRALEIGFNEEKLVDDVQQRIHDERIDSVWPACPEHRTHPLEYRAGAWRCPRGGEAGGQLGSLQKLPPLPHTKEPSSAFARRPFSMLKVLAFVASVGAAMLLYMVILRLPIAPLGKDVLKWLAGGFCVGTYWWTRARIDATIDARQESRDASRPAL